MAKCFQVYFSEVYSVTLDDERVDALWDGRGNYPITIRVREGHDRPAWWETERMRLLYSSLQHPH